jgi:hypothetical protein
MKVVRLIIGLVLVTAFLTGCQQEDVKDQKYLSAGRAASQKLTQSLKAALISAITDSGAAGAVSVCSEKALSLTAEIDAQSDSITDIRRISDKFRNPHNAPDPVDREALAYFMNYRTEHDSLPPYYLIQEQVDVRYYQPLVAQPLCLNCHGEPGKMDKSGDLRGLIRVTLVR